MTFNFVESSKYHILTYYYFKQKKSITILRVGVWGKER